MAPTVVWIPGVCHVPAHFDGVSKILAARGIDSTAIALPTVGAEATTVPPGVDAKAVRSELEKLVNGEGRELVVVGHSYGGNVLSQVVRGLERSKRAKEGKQGGIVRAVWMTAFVLKEGDSNLAILQREGDVLPDWVAFEVSVDPMHLDRSKQARKCCDRKNGEKRRRIA